MCNLRKTILLVFAALSLFGAADAARAQTQPGGAPAAAGAQSPKGSPGPAITPQVRPAFPQGLLPAPPEQDAASREEVEADKRKCKAQAQEEQRLVQETQARGYWVDPTTGLMWAAKDNGKDVSWKGAVKYCHNLRLAGYSNWRLATLSELAGIYDKNANAPGLARLGGPAKGSDFTWHVKGNLFLTGDEWSNERRYDDRGKPSGYEWYYDFNEGRSDEQPSGFPYPHSLMRALCVRGSEK